MGGIHGGHSATKNLETWSLVWLDASIGQRPEDVDAQQKLRSVVNQLQVFGDAHKCKKYIKSLSKDDRLIFIVSEQQGAAIVPRLHSYRQVISIYIFVPTGRVDNDDWMRKFAKVKLKRERGKGQ